MKTSIYSMILGAIATPALAITNPDVDLVYSDLRAAYSGGIGGQFFTFAEDTIAHQSFGTVTRLVAATGQADFQPGFVSGFNPADFHLSIQVGPTTLTTALGTGSFSATDANGDTIQGSFAGVFTLLGGTTDFTGALSLTSYNNNSGDNSFNGTNGPGNFALFATQTVGGTINITTPVTGMFTGTAQTLLIEPLTTVHIVVGVPAPGGAAAGLAALGVIGVRRRRGSGSNQ